MCHHRGYQELAPQLIPISDLLEYDHEQLTL
jgi:hypothetical protein